MSFWNVRKKLHPLVCLAASLTIVIFGFVMAKNIHSIYFLAGMFCWLMLFGCAKTCLRMLPMLVIVGGAFYGIFYATSGDTELGLSMTIRSVAVFLAVVPGLSTEPVRMTRSLSQIHTPRGITLGMLIAMSFGPTLKCEIRRVREAMKTRGAGSILNPKILYRAFLVPFIMRLINISDTLALSVETRGFTLEKKPYTVYRREVFTIYDALFLIGIIVGIVLVVVL